LISGQIQMLFISLAPVAQYVKSGRLKALAVSSAAPFSLVPELPTVASGGVPGFASSLWNGIVVPAGTPASIVDRLHAEIARVLTHPETREKILGLGFDPVGSKPAQFREFIRTEIERSARIVNDAGIRIE
jgi:tripartite-type tricarboxylate transporter receptor subunit TctC